MGSCVLEFAVLFGSREWRGQTAVRYLTSDELGHILGCICDSVRITCGCSLCRGE